MNKYILLITIFYFKLTYQENLINKCCPGQILELKNGLFSCKNSSNLIRINVVFKSNFTEVKCLDVYENKVIMFYRKNDLFIKSNIFDVLTKCCPGDFFYHTIKKSCEKLNKNNTFNENIFKIGLPQCQIITDVILDSKTELINNSTSLHLLKNVFTDNQFCLDETSNEKYVARLCRDWSVCEKMKCIKKCCVDGKSFVNGSHCEDTFVHGLEFKQMQSFIGDTNDDFAVIHGYQGSVYIEPNFSTFFLDKHGIFHNKKTGETINHPSQPYCIEHAKKHKSVNRFVYFGFLIKKSPPLGQKFLWNRAAMIVSSGFLVFTIIFYIFSKETRKIFGKTLVCFCSSLLILYILLVYHTFHTNLHISKTKNLCKGLGFSVIYLGFCSFFWLQIMCFDINCTFGTNNRYLDKTEKKNKEFKKFLFYNLYGWGFPLLLTMLLVTFHFTESLPNSISIRMGKTKCGIEKGNYAEILFRAVPLTIIQITNSIFFIKTVNYVLQVKRDIKKMIETPSTLKKKRRFFKRQQRFGLVIKLSFTMGIFYLFEVISSFFDFNEFKATAVLEIIWDFINCLQGLFIFLIFVCKRKNYDKFKKSNAMERIRKISLTTSRKTSLITTHHTNVNID